LLPAVAGPHIAAVVDLRKDFPEPGSSTEGVVAEGFAEGLALIATSGKVLAVPSPDVDVDPGQRRMRVTAINAAGSMRRLAPVRGSGLPSC
jgi:hypothetical protein